MAEVSDWYPIPSSGAVDCAAINQQLDLAQTDYDPLGRFFLRRELSFMFTLTRDTTGLDVPAIYRSRETRLAAYVSAMPGQDIRVSLEVETPDSKGAYSSHEDNDIPHLVALLGGVACVELAEFETRPRNALKALSRLDQSYAAFGRQVAQRTYDPERTETDAVHLTVIQMEQLKEGVGSTNYTINFGRPFSMQVQGESTNFVYWQYISGGADGGFVQNPRAFLHTRPFPLGAEYDGETYGFELFNDEPRRRYVRDNYPQGHKEMPFSELEGLLQLAGNTYIGPIDGEDVARIVCEPLNAGHRLHI